MSLLHARETWICWMIEWKRSSSMDNYIGLQYIEVSQPIGSFYITSFNYQDLLSISYADIRRIDDEARDEDNFDTYLGIQRQVSNSRIKEIKEYIQTIDATFPTSIILHIKSAEEMLDGKPLRSFDEDYIDENRDRVVTIKNIFINQEERKLYVRRDENVAQIIDGQHRLEGFRAYEENGLAPIPFELNVTIFVDLDLDDQAQIFSVINKAQTKVNKSLVYDLYEYARFRSPQKTAHDVVRLLNRREDSPFYRKIKILGSAKDVEKETIAQATFAEAIIHLISKDPMKDRDDLRRETLFRKAKLDVLPIQTYVFRHLFEEEKDEYIAKNLLNYFSAVLKRWPISWGEKAEGNILNKSTGLLALMRLFKDIVNMIGVYDNEIEESSFASYLNRIEIADGGFNRIEFVPGTSGQSKLYHVMLDYINKE